MGKSWEEKKFLTSKLIMLKKKKATLDRIEIINCLWLQLTHKELYRVSHHKFRPDLKLSSAIKTCFSMGG